jgi:xanthine/uracil permease
VNKRSRAPLVVGLIIAVIGVVIIGVSVQSLVASPSSDVKCNGEVMNTGDSCKTTTNGSTSTKSYGEMKSEKKSIVVPVIGIAFGSLLAVWAGVILFSAYRPRRE